MKEKEGAASIQWRRRKGKGKGRGPKRSNIDTVKLTLPSFKERRPR